MSPPGECGGALTLALKVTPKAALNRIQGLASDGAGGVHVKVSVTAAPEKGKANKAVVRLLAKALGVPKTSFAMVSGHTGRHKVVGISGDMETLRPLLRNWVSNLGGKTT